MSRRTLPAGGASLLAVAVLGLAACGAESRNNVAKAAAENVAKTKAALTVTAVGLSEMQWAQGVAASGNIAAWQETAIGSEIGGLRLADVRVDVGDVVSQGQLLATLAAAPVEADLAQARAALAEAQAAFAEARANGDRARKFEGSGAISQQQIAQYLTAEQTAKARIDVAKARLHSEELRLRQTRIVAPDDGVISARAATVGTVPAVGQELFRLILRGRLEWRAEVNAAEIGRIKPGAAATLSLASGTEVGGKVRAVAPAVDPQTRNGIVYVDLKTDARSREAKAGMFARGQIELAQSAAASRVATLPQSAVSLRDGFSYVFRIGADAKVGQVKVVTGRRLGERIEILSGLAAGDRVVEAGVGFLADGDLVELVSAAPAATAAATAKP
ncbi:MAG TPA: efflux RND transporter periplasmic adaptor subunit [Rhodocyclaceae bacterium]|nr:efflux RND transporter periplasmic adaptor subunit [Rhodocyclaceae bacterium]